jgi:hypothetical protein
MLVNHRSMLEVALLEQQIEEMRQLLASERSIPLPLITQRNGSLSHHSHLAAQVAELRKLVEARFGNAGPLYLRDGEPIPDGVDAERVVFIKRVFVEPPERDEEPLPATQELSSISAETQRRDERRLLEYPNLGIV